MARPLKVNAIALISQANHPIIVRPFTDEDPLKYHYVAHTSLDVVEERLAMGPKFMDCYLGLLFIMDEVAVYGYVTPTRVKIILALELADAVVRDADVIAIFKATHSAYHESISSPFTRYVGSPEATGTDPSPLLAPTTPFWKILAKKIDDVGRAIGSLPPQK